MRKTKRIRPLSALLIRFEDPPIRTFVEMGKIGILTIAGRSPIE